MRARSARAAARRARASPPTTLALLLKLLKAWTASARSLQDELGTIVAAHDRVARRRPLCARPRRLEPPPRPATTRTCRERPVDSLPRPPRADDLARVAADPLPHAHVRPHLRPLAPNSARPPRPDDAARTRARHQDHLCRRRQQERALHSLDRRARCRGSQGPPPHHGGPRPANPSRPTWT